MLTLPYSRIFASTALRGGSTRSEREQAQRKAEATIAAAQAIWEAAATVEGWARLREAGEA